MATTPHSKLPKKQYQVVVVINAPIEKCFAAATAEEAMMHWAPGFGLSSVVYDHSKASEPYGRGSERLATLKPGISILERIHISDKPTFLVYLIPSFGFIGDLMIKNYQAHMTFKAIDQERTGLTWEGYFDCPGSARITERFARMAMKSLITTAANKLQKYLSDKRI